MMRLRGIKKIQRIHNVPVLVRAALNVPVENGAVVNTFRLRQALPTIEYLSKKGARVILIGHIGEQGTETLAPVYDAMKQFIPRTQFCPVTVGAKAREAVRALHPGDVLMLENLRRDKGEVMNSKEFAASLAELADVFVEDSFDVCHRAHASVVSVPELLPSYAGFLVEKEVKELSKALSPRKPALAIIGGAKFSTKEPVLKKLITKYGTVFVGGALANDFMQALGKPIGKSLISGGDQAAILALAREKQIALPVDYIVAPFGSDASKGRAANTNDVSADEAILDAGKRTVTLLGTHIAKAKTILWNGPLGNYEKGFIESTEALAMAIAKSKARSVIGGGDTVASIEKLNLSDRFSFISTGGGAMLDFLAKGTLPGLEVLRKKSFLGF